MNYPAFPGSYAYYYVYIYSNGATRVCLSNGITYKYIAYNSDGSVQRYALMSNGYAIYELNGSKWKYITSQGSNYGTNLTYPPIDANFTIYTDYTYEKAYFGETEYPNYLKIEWDGNTEGRTKAGSYYKVSDCVITSADLSIGWMGHSEGGSRAMANVSKWYDNGSILLRYLIEAVGERTRIVSILSGKAGTYSLNGSTCTLPEDGTYFYGSVYTDYTNLLRLPAYTGEGGGFSTAETPTITTNLELFKRYTYEQGDIAETLTVEAEVSDGGTLTYQWLRSGTDVDPIIPNATESSYTPPTDQVCSRHYQCRVTNTNAAGYVAYAYSNFVIVDVVPAGTGDSGDTGDDPENDTSGGSSTTAAALESAYWAGYAAARALYGRKG